MYTADSPIFPESQNFIAIKGLLVVVTRHDATRIDEVKDIVPTPEKQTGWDFEWSKRIVAKTNWIS